MGEASFGHQWAGEPYQQGVLILSVQSCPEVHGEGNGDIHETAQTKRGNASTK